MAGGGEGSHGLYVGNETPGILLYFRPWSSQVGLRLRGSHLEGKMCKYFAGGGKYLGSKCENLMFELLLGKGLRFAV